jgi:glucose/arabinose dehydrogenase
MIYGPLKYIVIRRTEIFCLYLFFILLASIIANPINIVAQVYQSNSDKQYNKTKYYGCNKNYDTSKVDCDPLTNSIESYRMLGSSKKLYNATNDKPLFTANEEGKNGKALEVDAKYSESVILSDQLKLNSSGFSVSFWIKPSSEYHGVGHIISYACKKCFPDSGWYFEGSSRRVNDSRQSVTFSIHNNTGGLYSAGGEVIIPYNVFTHVVGIFDGSNIRIFRNGILVAQTAFHGIYNNTNAIRAGTDFYGTYPLKVGTASYCNACFLWTGFVDDLQIYNKALTVSEVKQIYSFGSLASDSISNDDLIRHWTFDGNLNDSTGNNKPGRVSTLIASMAFAPDGRLFFTEKNTGNIRIMTKDNQVLATPFVTVHDIYVHAEQGLLGLTIDPKFEQNRFVYVYYTYLDEKTAKPFNRVVRFTDDGNNRASLTYTVLLDRIPASKGFHSSGALAFGSKDDKLYITVGDAAMGNTLPQNSSSLLGKVLRINRDGTIPRDNPYPNSPIYNIGHRNMFGIAFNNKDGFGLLTENGADLYDEINTVEKGGNYGYPTLQRLNIAPELSNSSSDIKPLRSYKSVVAPTQAIFYHGDKIPELKNKFLFGSLSGAIYSFDITNISKKQITEERIDMRLFPFEGVIGLTQSPSGHIYFGDHSIYKLESINHDSNIQALFPIQINSSLDTNLASIQTFGNPRASGIKTNITLNMNKINNDTFGSHLHDFLNIRTSENIMRYTISVTALDNQSEKKELHFTLTFQPRFTIINIPLDYNIFNNSTKILIAGRAL